MGSLSSLNSVCIGRGCFAKCQVLLTNARLLLLECELMTLFIFLMGLFFGGERRGGGGVTKWVDDNIFLAFWGLMMNNASCCC